MVLRRAAAECPKKVSALVDLVNLPTALREFAGGRSQLSHLSFFLRVWSHIKNNNLQDPTNRNIINCDDKLKTVLLGRSKAKNPAFQDPTNRNIINCDDKLKTVLLGRSKVELSELPMLVKLHFPKVSKP